MSGLGHSIISLFLYLSIIECPVCAKDWVRKLYLKCHLAVSDKY